MAYLRLGEDADAEPPAGYTCHVVATATASASAVAHPSVHSKERGGTGFVEMTRVAPRGLPKKAKQDMHATSLFVASEAMLYAIRQNAQSGLTSVSMSVDCSLAREVCYEVARQMPSVKRVVADLPAAKDQQTSLCCRISAFW